MPVFHPHVT